MKPPARSPEPELWLSGINPVKEALKTERGSVQEMLLARTDSRGDELLTLAKTRGMTPRTVERNELTALLGHDHHQGVALRASDFPYASPESLFDPSLPDRKPVLILDSIQDPQNLGAMMRSACFLGAGGIIIPKDRSAKITPAVMKVAAGAAAYLPVAQAVNLVRIIEAMKEAGLWVVGLDAEESQSLYETDLAVPLALVVGNEQKGIRPLVRKACDLAVRIPALGPLQSLNAGAAAAVALAECARQRLANRRP